MRVNINADSIIVSVSKEFSEKVNVEFRKL